MQTQSISLPTRRCSSHLISKWRRGKKTYPMPFGAFGSQMPAWPLTPVRRTPEGMASRLGTLSKSRAFHSGVASKILSNFCGHPRRYAWLSSVSQRVASGNETSFCEFKKCPVIRCARLHYISGTFFLIFTGLCVCFCYTVSHGRPSPELLTFPSPATLLRVW